MSSQSVVILENTEDETSQKKDVYRDHKSLVKKLKEEGLPDREACSIAWDQLLEQAITTLR